MRVMKTVEFEIGAVFGMCMTVVLMIVFMQIFGQDDDEPKDDEWNPWGKNGGRK